MPTSIALLLDELEDMVRRDPDRALAQAQRQQTAAEEAGDLVLVRRAVLVQADVLARRGRTAECVRVFRDVNEWATKHDHAYLRARSHRLLSALFRRIGDSVLALEHAVPALELLEPDVRPALRADHLLGLADALGSCQSYDDARARYQEASRLAEVAGDLHLRVIALNNMTYTEVLAGRADHAVASAERVLAASETHGVELLPAIRDTVARALMMVGRYEAAERTLIPGLAEEDGEPLGDFDQVANALLTMAEIYRHQDRPVLAQLTLDRCLDLCDRHQLNGVGVRAQREQAELLAHQGSWQEAYEVFKGYHEANSQLNSSEREARARTRQAIYEVTEARRDSARFRELAVRDPLTGLHNRRFIDEKLPALLLNCVDVGMRLTVALLDIDHFKSVNDTYSHDNGDEVLRRVARILQDGCADVRASVVARMGGEEFLLVLPGLPEVDAVLRLDRLRAAVAHHDWSDVTPGFRITLSVGAVTAPDDGVDMSTLLRRADANLYEAKDAGRNAVRHGWRQADRV
ncbi:GGDEF domain-containing protein [Thalassiella azotivora]